MLRLLHIQMSFPSNAAKRPMNNLFQGFKNPFSDIFYYISLRLWYNVASGLKVKSEMS